MPVHNMRLGQGVFSLLLPLLACTSLHPRPHRFSEEALNLARVVADHLSDGVPQTRSD